MFAYSWAKRVEFNTSAWSERWISAEQGVEQEYCGHLHLAGEVPDEGDGGSSIDTGAILTPSVTDGAFSGDLNGSVEDLDLIDEFDAVVDGEGRRHGDELEDGREK